MTVLLVICRHFRFCNPCWGPAPAIDTLTHDGARNLLHGAQSGATLALALALLLLYGR